MNEAKLEKLKRFANDRETSGAVFELIKESFLKSTSNKEVNYLAAKWLAIESLNDAWKELDQFRAKEKELEGRGTNIGL